MDAFDKISKRTTLKTKKRVQRNLAIANRIYEILLERDMSQLDLAKLMGKHASEISKWLTGQHNFEIKTIENIEDALGREIISVGRSAFIYLPQQETDLFKYQSIYGVSKRNPPMVSNTVFLAKTKKQHAIKSVIHFNFQGKNTLLWQNNTES